MNFCMVSTVSCLLVALAEGGKVRCFCGACKRWNLHTGLKLLSLHQLLTKLPRAVLRRFEKQLRPLKAPLFVETMSSFARRFRVDFVLMEQRCLFRFHRRCGRSCQGHRIFFGELEDISRVLGDCGLPKRNPLAASADFKHLYRSPKKLGSRCE